MVAKVLDPVRGMVFGDEVEASLALGEPDFDFARAAALATAGGEVEILFVGDRASP